MMSILDLHAEEFATAAQNTPIIQPKKPEPGFSLWRTIDATARGPAAALTERAGFLADTVSAFGQVLGAYPEAMGPGVNLSAEQRKQADKARQDLLASGPDYSSEAGDLFRETARGYRPDPATAGKAEEIMFGLSRGLSKVVTDVATLGPIGAALSGVDEASMVSSDLKGQGVALGPRTAAGIVQGGFMAGGAVLPLAGQTLKQTAALYFAGGPGGFLAMQALTRQILQADTPKVAAQFDPFDPVGLAVASLIPLPFAVHGHMSARAPVKPAGEFTPSQDHVDAARVQLQAEQRATAGLHEPGDIVAATRHETALTKAEDQIAAGERVDVGEVPVSHIPDEMQAIKQAIDARLTPMDDGYVRSVDSLPHPSEVAPDLRAMGEAAYWAQEGGRMLRSGISEAGDGGMGGDVVGRTPWIPAQEWFGRMRSDLGRGGLSNQADIKVAIEKAIAGEKLTASEGRTISFMRLELADMQDQMAASHWIDPPDVHDLSADAFGAGLGKNDALDVSRVAKAAELDPIALEDAHYQHRTDDAAFMRAVQEILDAHATQDQNGRTDSGSASPRAAQASADPAAAGPADASGGGLRAPDSAAGKGSGGQDAAAASADAQRLTQIAQDFPDLTVQMDGMDAPMLMSEFMAKVKAEADAMLADAPMFKAAAECALLNP